MGTIHETGHGRYEQNLPRELLGQPVAQARSMALHESQSLSFEMQLGCHPGFVNRIAPLVQQAFGAQPALEPQNLHRLLTRAKPGGGWTRRIVSMPTDRLRAMPHRLLSAAALLLPLAAFAQVQCWAPQEEMDAVRQARYAPHLKTLLAIEQIVRRDAAFVAVP